MRNLIDLINRRFGRLTVLRRVADGPKGQARWQCLCDCGAYSKVRGAHLRTGETKSCGCLQREVTIRASTKHGQARRGNVTREHGTWQNMINRCENPNINAPTEAIALKSANCIG